MTAPRRRHLLALCCLAALPGVAAAMPERIFAERGVAIRGYDPVAYVTEGRPVPGSAAFALAWGGATCPAPANMTVAGGAGGSGVTFGSAGSTTTWAGLPGVLAGSDRSSEQ